MKFNLYFIEYHSDVELWEKQGYNLLGMDSDDWGEFEHTQEFEAESIEEAKKLVSDLSEMQFNSSGVFNVYHKKELVFTEEGI